METSEREWQRQTRCFELFLAYQLSRYEGSRTFRARLQRKLCELRYQFLPHYFVQPPKWRISLRSLRGPRTLPDFACISTIKAGSTDLAAYLLQHPAIIPPLSKEVSDVFVDAWPAYYPTVREKELLHARLGNALTGTFTPALHSVAYLDSLAEACPQAKIVILLRDPVSRAYSHYKWAVFMAGKRVQRYAQYQSFAAFVDTALDLFPEVAFPAGAMFPFLHSGIYAKPVRRWIERFGRDRTRVVRAEDFFRSPQETVGGIHEFLGLPRIEPVMRGIVLENPLRLPPADEETNERLRAFYWPWNHQLYEILGEDLGWQ